ncbi:MAG: glycosyltransferase family 39 protein [Verrucomicrobiota bacterium]|nr:glycosyltransferase family 39 protein [Chthoniobacterales bacterium]MDQ3415432.1 glycosyltransferase family 39 protein [Verrucomicrobiota bacterium]
MWAAIYLPRLGSLEIKSEEGRRILPAVTMLETGNYIVPQVGSDPYLRKPPLVNWLVAGSFKLFGVHNEWTARLPSVLCVLAVALAFVSIAHRSLGPNGAIAAALIWLTNFGLLEKGRLIEIEALYVSLTALAFICWLSWWKDRPWRAWITAGIFLGLGLLAKGPLHLLFFYSVVCAVLWQAGEVKRLWSWPHFLGFILMLGIFAAWAIPCLQQVQAGHAATVWTKQFSGRVSGDGFKFGDWLMNIPRGVAYLLPWAALLPFARFTLLENEADRKFCRALSLGVAIPFLVVNLLPGALPRYTMPLLPPAIWLLAIFIREHALLWPKPLRKAITWTVAVITGAMLIYALAIIPVLQGRAKIRPLARQLETAIPPNEKLYAVDPEYQPFLFYLRRPIVYLSEVAELPPEARYLLVQPADEKAALARAEPILPFEDYRGRRVILLRVRPKPPRAD